MSTRYTGLTDSLVENAYNTVGDYKTLNFEIGDRFEDIDSKLYQIDRTKERIERGSEITEYEFRDFQQMIQSIKDSFDEIEDLFNRMHLCPKSQKEEKKSQELRKKFAIKDQKFSDNQHKYEALMDKAGVRGGRKQYLYQSPSPYDANNLSTASSDAGGGGKQQYQDQIQASYQKNQEENKVKVFEVYEQTQMIESRTERIRELKEKTKDLNQAATIINAKIHEQDDVLDDLNKNMKGNVGHMEEANENMQEVVMRANRRPGNKRLLAFILFVMTLLGALGFYFYYHFYM